MNDKKIKKPFYQRWWFIALVVLFVLSSVINTLKSPEEKAKEEAERQQIEQQRESERVEKEATKKAERKAKEEAKAKKERQKSIKESIESLIDDTYKEKQGFSVDVLELIDGGFSVNAQIPYDVDTEESERLLSDLLTRIKDLKLDDVNDITIFAMLDMQFVNVVTSPDNKEFKEEILSEAKKRKEERQKKKRQAWIDRQFNSDGSHATLTSLIIDNLNDEDSFKHKETKYIDVIDKDYAKGVLKEAGVEFDIEVGDLIIFTEFSAKNSFGGVVKSIAVGVAKASDNTVTLLKIE